MSYSIFISILLSNVFLWSHLESSALAQNQQNSLSDQPLPIMPINPDMITSLQKGDALIASLTTNNWEELTQHLADWTGAFVSSLVDMTVPEGSRQTSPLYRMLVTQYTAQLRTDLPGYTNIYKQIVWSKAKQEFASYEQSIIALEEDIEQMMNAPTDTIKAEKREYFVKQYKSDYRNAANHIFVGLTQKSETDVIDAMEWEQAERSNLMRALLNAVDGHLDKVKTFVSGTIKLIVEAIRIEATYSLLVSGRSANNIYVENVWHNKLKTLQTFMVDLESILKSQWQQYMLNDIMKYDMFMNDTKKGPVSVSIYGDQLYNLLADKFPWRSWLVIVTENQYGFDKQAMTYCTKYIFASFGMVNLTKNVVVGSIPLDADRPSLNTTAIEMASMELSTKLHDNNKARVLLVEQLNGLGVTSMEQICQNYPFVGFYLSSPSKQDKENEDSTTNIYFKGNSKSSFTSTHVVKSGYVFTTKSNYNLYVFG